MSTSQRSGGQRFLENLAYMVPGYEGYKQRKMRKEEDARLRVRVHRRLLQQIQIMDDIHERWVKQPWGNHIEELDRRRLQLQSIADSVRYSPYSSQDFFDTETVNAQIIDSILESDLLILEDLQETQEHLDNHLRISTAPRTTKAFFDILDKKFDGLEQHLMIREKILASA